MNPSDIKHDGDCSIYEIGCDICDCGALRRTVRNGTDSQEIWDLWRKHLDAKDRSMNNNNNIIGRENE